MAKFFLKKIICLILILQLFQAFKIKTQSFAYFSPDDKPKEKLVELINRTNYKISAAVYIISEKTIAQALINAKKRGVKIKILTDDFCIGSSSGKTDLLQNSGIKISVFKTNTKNSKFHPIMHNKFGIFEIDKKNINDNWVWTGSFNWTKSASQINQENVILTNNKKVFASYKKQFKILKKRCTPIKSISEQEREALVASNFGWRDKIKDFLKFVKSQF